MRFSPLQAISNQINRIPSPRARTATRVGAVATALLAVVGGGGAAYDAFEDMGARSTCKATVRTVTDVEASPFSDQITAKLPPKSDIVALSVEAPKETGEFYDHTELDDHCLGEEFTEKNGVYSYWDIDTGNGAGDNAETRIHSNGDQDREDAGGERAGFTTPRRNAYTKEGRVMDWTPPGPMPTASCERRFTFRLPGPTPATAVIPGRVKLLPTQDPEAHLSTLDGEVQVVTQQEKDYGQADAIGAVKSCTGNYSPVVSNLLQQDGTRRNITLADGTKAEIQGKRGNLHVSTTEPTQPIS